MSAPVTLEEHLEELARFGEVALHQMGHQEKGVKRFGWWCKVELFVMGAGLAARVDSETKHPTPLAAAKECYERLGSMFESMRGLPELGGRKR